VLLIINDIHSTVGHALRLVQNKLLHCEVPDPLSERVFSGVASNAKTIFLTVVEFIPARAVEIFLNSLLTRADHYAGSRNAKTLSVTHL
jgi:hypothetical protein